MEIGATSDKGMLENKHPPLSDTVDDTQQPTINTAKGGWITSPFFLGSKFGTSIAAGAWSANLIVFLINKFNVNTIDAALINSIVSGFTSFFPIVGAILADTLLGSYVVALVSTILSLLGTIMFTMIVTITKLDPKHCNNTSSINCKSPTKFQNGFLYITLAFASIGAGGSFLILATMGADQLNKAKHQRMILDWIIFTWYFGWVLSFTVLVYIEDNVSWILGFGIGVAANVIALTLLLCGTPFFRRITPQGSPMTSIARVFVASVRKINFTLSSEEDNTDCCYYQNTQCNLQHEPPSKTLRFLNRAAMLADDDIHEPTRAAKGKSWRLCSVQEVEDLKKLIKLFPIWLAGIFYSVPISITQSLTILQALVMDRHLGTHFEIPASTFGVFSLLSTALTIIALESIFYPLWKRITQKSLRPLQRLGIGHCFNIVGMIMFALVERKRLSIVNDHLMSALWLVLPLAIVGAGEAFQFPGEVAFQYQEFPKSLRNTSAGIVSLRTAIAFYLSAAFIGVLQRMTSWLPNDLNHGRVDCVYWMNTVVAFVNFVYYLTYVAFYKYNNLSFDDDDDDK